MMRKAERPNSSRKPFFDLSELLMLSKAKAKGFTLVELVVVVVIIGILAAVAAPKFLNKTDAAKAQVSLQKLAAVKNAIEMYRADNSSYPTAANLPTDMNTYIKGGLPSVEFGLMSGNGVITVATDPVAYPTPADADKNKGYIYNPTTGSIWLNNADLFDGKY
jgi:general secretion pathway protein G